MNFVKTFKKYHYQIFLFLILFFLFLTNYKFGTYLSGWDNLQTELYPWLAVKRAFFSVWQEYQSFGLLAGMAHAADLLRAIFIWFISFIIPQNLIRYFYHFLMLFLGGLGAFKLLTQNLKLKTQNQSLDLTSLSFLGALFYILNLATIQMFYLPFEPFSTFFAFLPWGIWSFLKLISNIQYPISKKDWIVFFLINLLGTPSFYVQQLFVVYLLILFLIFLAILTETILTTAAKRWYLIKKSFFLFTLIFLINSFWLLPQLYFLKTSSNVVYEAKANQLATEDVYFQNREKGTLSYFLKLEGFYFDLFDKTNQLLFLPWKNHFKNFWPLQYLFAFLMILGLINSLRKKDYLFVYPFILITIVFLNATWPISLLDGIIRSNKLLNQIFRSPFTKFIILYSLLYSYFLAYGIKLINSKFQALNSKFNVSRFTFYISLILITLYSLPAFRGFFISPEMKIKIPDDYFQVMDYFKTVNKNTRIALLPEYTFWGWFFHRWGYNGSGFLWYGIEQPIVSRTFDVWSDKSEGYFWEVKSALEAEDLNRWETVLDKYDIDYLLVDYSLLPVVGTIKGLQYDRIDRLLNTSSKISLVKKWPNIALYEFKDKENKKDFISLKNDLLNIGPKIKLTNYDKTFYDSKDYYNDASSPDIYYPFLDLTTQTRLKNKNWQIKETKDKFLIEAKANFDFSKYQLNSKDNIFQATIYQNNKLATYSGNIKTQLIENNQLQVAIDKVLVEKINLQNIYQEKCFKNTLCFGFSLPYIPQKYGYLIKIKNKNLTGRRLFFYILDQTKKQAFLEERLQNDEEFFILSPKYQYGLGYSLNFHENSYQNLKSKNIFEELEIYLFPYENLKSLRLLSPKSHLLSDSSQDGNIDLAHFDAKKLNYFTYQVSFSPISNIKYPITIYLSQSFHPGWKAYQIQCQNSKLKCQIFSFFPFLFGKEIKEHVLVNNWANGWQLPTTTYPPQTNIIIIFWPQYLEFLGFGLLILGLIYILRYSKIKSYEN